MPKSSMRRPGARPGFTLTEILVAASLIGVVMAMAMQAFMGLSRISEQTRSQIVAQSEASKGVHAVAALLRRAHVVYFTGRPLSPGTPNFAERGDGLQSFAAGGNVNDLVGQVGVDPVTLPIPASLGATGLARTGSTFYSFGVPPTFPLTGGPPVLQYSKAKFRFWDWGDGANNATLNGNQRLRTADPAAQRAYDLFFSSPLMYIAEAELAKDVNTAGTSDGTVANMFMPLTWTFHIVYLAPMDVKNPQRAPAWTATARASDLAAAGWQRSTIPFELRVMTVPGVEADLDGARATAQRVLPDGTVAKPPFDYVAGNVNYHPVPVPLVVAPLAGALTPAEAMAVTNSRRIQSAIPPAAPPPAVPASGPRVAGAVPHANYNNIGNDPPSNTVFQRARLGAAAPRDTVLAQYVDPDSVHGTFVRLLNTLGAAPHSAAGGELTHAMRGGMGVYRKYLNAYGGEFLYNHYAALLPNPLPVGMQPWDVTRGSSIPRRALVGVSTRYRTDSRVKFSFATETIELDLENVVRFQTLNGSLNL